MTTSCTTPSRGESGRATWDSTRTGASPLESYVYFGADGFGTDELRYADTGRYLDTLNIQWDAYDDKIYISYGRADYPRELRNVYIRRGRLTGELFIDGQYYDRVTLYMQ